MAERVCKNCRWWSVRSTELGYCHKRLAILSSDEAFPSTHKSCWCGEWADASITPEQEEQRELIRRFAVAIIGTEWGGDLEPIRVWPIARDLAMMESAAEPRIQKENEQ